VRRLGSFLIAAFACYATACGRGVSEDPLASEGLGGTSLHSGGSSGSTAATSGTNATGGAGPGSGSGGTSTGGNSGSGGASTGGVSGTGGLDDPECAPGRENVDGECLLVEGEECDSHGECASGNCADGVCCGAPCDGLCEHCDTSGTCRASETDAACQCAADTRCVEYRPPAPNACSGRGQCAECEPIYERKGVPCDVGRQCDGAGACELTGLGRVAAGERHTCMIDDDANVVCWGDNRFGQLGAVFALQRIGLDERLSDVPGRTLDFYEDVVQITAGAQHTCVLFHTGDVRCWGTMYDHPTFGVINSIWGTAQFEFVTGSEGMPPGAVGELEEFGFIDPLHTGNVMLADTAEQISAAPDGATICALLRSGNISCWGLNIFGQLGLGDRLPLDLAHEEFLPVVELAEPAIEVRSALGHTCVLTESGRVQCWGDGTYGRLGSGESGSRYSPGDYVDIGESGEPVVGLAVGLDHNCVLLTRGAVRCWGNNHQGQLGYGHTLAIGDNETPAQAVMQPGPDGREYLGGDVALGTEIIQVMTFPASSTRSSLGIWDSSPTCALTKDRFVRCWGRNDVGQLGYGHNQAGATEHTPFELEGIRSSDEFVMVSGQVLALAEGGRCALQGDEEAPAGSLYCWGANDHGQVGVQGNAFPSLTQRPFDLGPIHWW
jgi:alpha-tubulin suppressor-like RCC1 family protein